MSITRKSFVFVSFQSLNVSQTSDLNALRFLYLFCRCMNWKNRLWTRRKKWSFTVQRCKKLYGVLRTSCQAESACHQKIKRKPPNYHAHKILRGQNEKTTETLVSL